MPPLIDCHLHLQDSAFAPDISAVVDRAIAAGVRRFICNGTRPDDWARVAELAHAFPEIIPCFGLHPWHIRGVPADWPDVLEASLASMPSAIGEIGLDRWIEPRDERAQEEAFRIQLAVARRRGMPVMVHCLRAWGWLMDVLRSEPPLPAGMLIHAYGGPAELIKPLAERGAYFSFAGNVLEPRKAKAREALGAVPSDLLLVETDSPDMPPPPEFGSQTQTASNGHRRNEPANLPHILCGIAAIRGMSEENLAEAVWNSAHRLLGPVLSMASSSPPR